MHEFHLTNWATLALVRPQTRVERREFPRQIPGILTTIPNPRLIASKRPTAVEGEVINGHIRCGGCGRKRNELIATARQFVCKRCAN